MNLTFEEYLKTFEVESNWMPRPTFEGCNRIQEECMIMAKL